MTLIEKECVRIVEIDTCEDGEACGFSQPTCIRERICSYAEDDKAAELVIKEYTERFEEIKARGSLSYILKREFRTEKAYIWLWEDEL